MALSGTRSCHNFTWTTTNSTWNDLVRNHDFAAR